MRRPLALAAATLIAAAHAAEAQSAQASDAARPGAPVTAQETVAMLAAVLRGLDTLAGVTEDLRLVRGETRRFGRLEITLDACLAPRDDPGADAYAHLTIRDVREAAPRFSGWMFASSPALSALDHPRYDVWVLSCSNA